ncbi:peptidase domain-containing ABC transporter [Marivirga sp. S37H4]|uniref:Peptidase domain-containing ABC transporter n=1 Tax=Marivirga aurantiaca TaxID=2802615 RepID=A0A935C994_9BACT|nr:peptidase domain-containing ABC transporter [Marivirga aurantiaca]MBK6265869.1 peptidase domain-containing ABC transporter [Marivirga aurantiaca]
MIKEFKKYFIQQHGQSDCGPACLASIIKYHGGEHSLDELRRITGTTQTGTKLLGLFQGAKDLGFEVEGLEAENIENLKELDEPAILHVVLENRMQHYVIFYGFQGDKLMMSDPGRGVELWSKEKLAGVWQSKTLLKLTPNAGFAKENAKSRRYENLLSWVKEDLNILLAALFLGIIIAIFSLATAIFSQKLIDVILPTKEIDKLIIGLVLFGCILLIKMGLSYVRSTFLITQSKDFNNRMISSFFESLLRIPKPFFDSKKTGDMVARMNDTRRIQTSISNLIGNLLIEFLVIIISLIGVFVYSWQVGIVVSIFIPIYALILWRLNKPIVNAQKDVMSAYALNEGNYIDVITGISEVKSTGTINLFHRTTTFLYKTFQEQVFKLGKIQVKFGLLTELAGILLIIAVISIASFLVLQGNLLLGSLVALLSLSGSIGPSLTRIALFNIQFQEAKVAFNRMEEFTGIKTEEVEGTKLNADSIETLAFDKVSFHYPGSLNLLKQINLQIKKSKIVTLLGESGAGKSTILQIMQRFYTPSEGEVKINTQSIQDLNLSEYRKNIGVVPQDIKIFNNYLLFNIALTDDPKKLEEVLPWCKANGFDQFFNKFPQGYMTLLGEEGSNISGGQKQLVGLARALYRNPEVLLIDEGTSAMDRNTEQFILNLLDKLKSEKAIMIVSHRMKVASFSDYIYILEKGKITAEGSPKDLLGKDNFYSRAITELNQGVDLNS